MLTNSNHCTWLDLVDEVLGSTRQRSNDLILPPASAIDEAMLWIQDPRDYSPTLHKGPWESSLNDLKQALNAMGGQLRSAVASQMAAVLVAIHDLPPPDKKKPTGTQRQNARVAIGALKAELISSAGPRAAWHDLIDVCRDGTASVDLVRLRRDQFFDLLDASGRNTQELSRMVSPIVRDDALAVMEARVALGEHDVPAPAEWPEPQIAAHLTVDERVELAARLLTVSPTPHHHVVWLAFDRARISSMILGRGDTLSFYDCGWVRGNLENRGPHLEDLPEEIRGEAYTAQGLPQAEDVVLARIDLGVTSDPDPARVARGIASGVVDVAGVKTGFMGRNNWRPIGGHLHAIDGRMVGWSAFDLPEDDRNPRAWRDVIAEGLPEVPVALFGSLSSGRSTLSDATRALRWLNEIELVEPMTAIFLQVRLIESAASWVTDGGESWYRYLDRYFQHVWIRDRIMAEIKEGVLAVVMGGFGTRHDVDPAHEADVQELRRKIVQTGPGLSLRTDIKQAVDAVNDLAAMFSPCSHRGRGVHTISARLKSVGTLAEWVDDLRRDWQVGLRRLQRCRNSLAHSGPITDATARSVQGISRQLACWSLARVVESLLASGDLRPGHEEMADQARAWADGIRKHSTVADALFAT